MILVELRLEREQGQHQVAGLANLQHALLPPGPHGRADVMHGLDASLTQLELESQVEIRRINADKHIGFGRDQGVDQPLAP